MYQASGRASALRVCAIHGGLTTCRSPCSDAARGPDPNHVQIPSGDGDRTVPYPLQAVLVPLPPMRPGLTQGLSWSIQQPCGGLRESARGGVFSVCKVSLFGRNSQFSGRITARKRCDGRSLAAIESFSSTRPRKKSLERSQFPCDLNRRSSDSPNAFDRRPIGC